MGRALQFGWFGATILLIAGVVVGVAVGWILFGDAAQQVAERRATIAESRLATNQKKLDRMTSGSEKTIANNAHVLDLCLVMLNVLGWHVDNSGTHLRYTGETLAANGESIDSPTLAPGQQNRIQHAIEPAQGYICEITQLTRILKERHPAEQ